MLLVILLLFTNFLIDQEVVSRKNGEFHDISLTSMNHGSSEISRLLMRVQTCRIAAGITGLFLILHYMHF